MNDEEGKTVIAYSLSACVIPMIIANDFIAFKDTFPYNIHVWRNLCTKD